MKRYSFGTFLVDDSNRDAFRLCQDVANLCPISPLPICILGDEGSGKTHLLYSIVNRVRATSSKTGLAYVTARDFPEQVRALINDPAPVERAESAILLVDQLEQFAERVDELEAVARIFLSNNHYVILASYIHPDRLTNLTEGLRSLLAGGQTVAILPQTSDTRVELLKRQARQESEDLINHQRQEIEELQALLEQVGASRQGAENAKELADLRSQLEQQRAAREALTKQLEAAKAELAREERDLRVAQQGLDKAAKADDESMLDLEDQIESLQTEKGDAQEEAERERGRWESEAAQRAALDQEVGALREDLQAARAEAEQARGEANRLLERAEELLGLVEAHRVRFTHVEEDCRKEVAALEAVLGQHRDAQRASEEAFEAAEKRTREAVEALEEGRDQWTRDRREVKEELARLRDEVQTVQSRAQAEILEAEEKRDCAVAEQEQLQADLERTRAVHNDLQHALEQTGAERNEVQAALEHARAEHEDLRAVLRQIQAERDDLRAAADTADAQLEAVREQLDETRRQLDTQAKEMDALRHEAAAQVAAANAQAGEIEGRLSKLQAAFDQVRQTGHEVGVEVHALTEQLLKTANAIAAASEQLTSWEEGPPEASQAARESALLQEGPEEQLNDQEGDGEAAAGALGLDEPDAERMEPKVIPLRREKPVAAGPDAQGLDDLAQQSSLNPGAGFEGSAGSVSSAESQQTTETVPSERNETRLTLFSGDTQNAQGGSGAEKRAEGSPPLPGLRLPPSQELNPLDDEADPSV